MSNEPTISVETLKRDLTNRFPVELHSLTICEHTLSLHGVPDEETLIDRLVASPTDSVEVRDQRLPYWASLWPSSVALAGYILAHSPFSSGARILELGCGLGLCSLAAMLQNAPVTATDYQPDALLFTRLNCLVNLGREPKTLLLDWRNPPNCEGYECLIASDLAYEARFFSPLLDCFQKLLAPGGQILFSEPNRELARPFFKGLHTAGWQGELLSKSTEANVYRLTRTP